MFEFRKLFKAQIHFLLTDFGFLNLLFLGLLLQSTSKMSKENKGKFEKKIISICSSTRVRVIKSYILIVFLYPDAHPNMLTIAHKLQ